MQRIIVTGSKGQLGQELAVISKQFSQYQFHFFSREELDISDAAAVYKTFAQLQPEFCINCAAYTAVDKAETEFDKAFAINATGVKNLAAAAAQFRTRFIHISTDYVFNGEAQTPYPVDHTIDPVNKYGETKAAGEKFCFAENPSSIVIRTSWVYSEFGNNFVKTMLRLMASKESINVVADQWGCPTYAADLAAALMHIISKADWKPGVYHYSNSGAITWFDFAKEIASFTNSSCVVAPIPSAAFPTPAKRPHYSVMDLSAIQSKLQVPLAFWKDSLHRCLRRLSTSQQ